MKSKYEFLYRDAGNYKAYFTASVEGKGFDPHGTVTMEELGLVPESFVPEIMEYPWNEDDHNILEVVRQLPADEDVTYELTYHPEKKPKY